MTLPVTNTGGGSLIIYGESISGSSFKIVSSTPSGCMSGTAAGQVCMLGVEFSPVRVGPHGDNLYVQTNASSSPNVRLKGTASGVGNEQESPIQFPTIVFGTTAVVPILIHNVDVSGSVTLSTSIGGPSFSVLNTAQNTCIAGVQAGASCVLPVEFSPVAPGYHSDLLTLTPSSGAPSKMMLQGIASPSDPVLPVAGDIYVLDSGHNRVQIFDAAGEYKSQFKFDFDEPTGIAVDATSVYVHTGDNDNCHVDQFDGSGVISLKFGVCGGVGRAYLEINGYVATDAAGNVWVTNFDGSLVHFDNAGNFLSMVCLSKVVASYVPNCPVPAGLPSGLEPTAITLDSSGNIYVTSSTGSPAVVKFDSTGKYLLSFGSSGAGNGQFSYDLQGIAVDSKGNIYVSDGNNNRVQVFDAEGKYKSQFGTPGAGNGQFNSPAGLALDAEGNLYVADTQNHRVQKFDGNGAYLNQFGTAGHENGQFSGIAGIAIAP